nr:hypothetical protein [Tanacetum cinerariifolium]
RRQLPVGRELRGTDRLVICKAFDMNWIVEWLEDLRDFFNDRERLVAGNRVTAAKQQARTELDFDPQLVATHRHLIGLDQ